MVENAEWLRYVHLIGYAWAFIAYYLIQFFRQFFRTKERSRHWDRWLIGLAVMNLILFFVHFISELYFNDWARFLSRTNNIVVFLLVPLSIIITFLLFTRDKDKSVRFVIIGSFPLMLFYFLFTFINLVDFFSKTTEHSPLYETFFSHFRIREIIFVVWMVLSFSWILFMRYDRLIKENALIALDKERLAKEKEIERNELIELQKTELEKQVAARTTDLKHSLEDLKSTQAQLIQSEKMASLGELTAGIAHEIQNPLNFVNNFSEVNTELIEEMKTELRAGNQEEAIALANDIAENEKKINLHGKRADSIVKGMLQHSRSSSGVKELTDINALADEFLRLSYHGLRAKDKSFNAGLKTDFDPSVGKIKIVTEEIGRVILNLLNNAFYAVSEKKRLNPEGYEPTVSIGTKLVSDQIEIKVSDNGNGIPQRVLDKIFQPFFTTKPAGQGTGLGLSLSYDIVTKGHDGKLVAETKEGEGSTFYIYLPYKS
jgi:signal transduction histidine kinase